MDFSECYRCSLLPAHSPDGAFIAVAVEYRLVIREAESLKVVQIYSCLDKIHSVAWSPNSKCVVQAQDCMRSLSAPRQRSRHGPCADTRAAVHR
jgi:hypothetical protein